MGRNAAIVREALSGVAGRREYRFYVAWDDVARVTANAPALPAELASFAAPDDPAEWPLSFTQGFLYDLVDEMNTPKGADLGHTSLERRMELQRNS